MNQPHHLHFTNSVISFGDHEATPENLAGAIERYLAGKRTGHTPNIEHQASVLAAQDFTTDNGITEFIQAVCWWGGHSGIGGRVLKHNTVEEIRIRLCAAKTAITKQAPDLQTAIREVRAIHSLGLSFASKHLRMLWPQHCPVLDSRIHEYLGYALNSTGYCAFAKDCRHVADVLNQQNISIPARSGRTTWYVADVEAAVFRLLNGQ